VFDSSTTPNSIENLLAIIKKKLIMDTKIWGPPLWVATHIMAQNYDPAKHSPESFKKFFNSMADTLPCIYCRQSYAEFIKELPIDPYLRDKPPKSGADKRGLPYWWYQIHNMVNKKLRDQELLDEPDPSFESIWKRYEQYRVDGCGKNSCRLNQKGSGAASPRPGFKKKQCTGHTQDGERCSRYAESGKRTCYQH